MRVLRSIPNLIVAAAWLAALLHPAPSLAQTPQGPVQSLFLGNKTCLDSAFSCTFPNVVASHRYLHVVLDDAPNNPDWKVQAGPLCSATMLDIAGGIPTDSSGYVEVVVDLQAVSQGSLLTRPTCYGFHGRNHWAVGFYTAYFDDSPLQDADQVHPGYRTLQGRPDLPDLDITYINRTPSYPYDAPKNVPSSGDTVTFQAHILNAGGLAAPPFDYVWQDDGQVRQRGRFDSTLAPGGETSISLPWVWDDHPHDLTFAVVPAGPETSERNDRLTIRSDAVMLGFWVERGAYRYFQVHQWEYCSLRPCTGSDSFEDWLQRQVAAWNRILATAVYPGFTPTGIADRIRVEAVHVVPDGALPLRSGGATNSPDSEDRSVDLEWGLPARDVDRAYRLQAEGPSDLDWGLVHELSHARSLADLYRFDIPLTSNPAIAVHDAAGRPAVDPAHPWDPSHPIHPFVSGSNELFLYQNQQQDLMSCPCTPFYSIYSALTLNRLRGRRARCGNINAPCNLGDWFRDIPPVSRIRILDLHGVPVPDGTRVKLFFDTETAYTAHAFDDAHGEPIQARHGEVQLGADPFRTGRSDGLGPAGHNLLLIEVQAGKKDWFCFQDPTDFNMAFWLGYRDVHHPAVFTMRLATHARNGCHLELPPARVNEPFATSPYDSQLHLESVPGPGANGRRLLTVHLRDDARPGNPMQNRRIKVLGGRGQTLAAGTTDSRGAVSVLVPAAVRVYHVIDVTDNYLVIPEKESTPPA